MREITLGVPERAAMFALMTVGSKASNPELRDRVGLVIDGARRRRLNDLKLVESGKQGRSYHHELTDEGWAWCAAELEASAPPRAGSLGNALYGVLALLGRYLDAADLSLGEFVNTARTETVDLPDTIRAAYWTLAREPQDWILLTRLRPLLGDISREAVDAALRDMEQLPDVHLAPEADQKTLTTADRDAAVLVGGVGQHLLAIEAR
jgi:hypothetical protein